MKELLLQLSSCRNIYQIVDKIFSTQCFFTDHLNHEIVNKRPCGTSSVNPRE